jgi:hypothetical protein
VLVIHTDYEPVIVFTDVEDDKLVPDRIRAPVCGADVGGVRPLRVLDDLMPGF